MSTLDAIWSVETSTDMTDDEKADAVAHLKAGEWSDTPTPIVLGSIAITEIYARGTVVHVIGEGGSVDWPLLLVNAPIAVADPDGVDVDPNGVRWRVDTTTILGSILSGYQ